MRFIMMAVPTHILSTYTSAPIFRTSIVPSGAPHSILLASRAGKIALTPFIIIPVPVRVFIRIS